MSGTARSPCHQRKRLSGTRSGDASPRTSWTRWASRGQTEKRHAGGLPFTMGARRTAATTFTSRLPSCARMARSGVHGTTSGELRRHATCSSTDTDSWWWSHASTVAARGVTARPRKTPRSARAPRARTARSSRSACERLRRPQRVKLISCVERAASGFVCTPGSRAGGPTLWSVILLHCAPRTVSSHVGGVAAESPATSPSHSCARAGRTLPQAPSRPWKPGRATTRSGRLTMGRYGRTVSARSKVSARTSIASPPPTTWDSRTPPLTSPGFCTPRRSQLARRADGTCSSARPSRWAGARS